ncbi:MAG: hypothetical protein ACTSVV_11925 [Promethearchaeota archaeon]
MGYDITAFDEKKNVIAYLEAPANVFEKIKYNGYDWFELINATECDGIVSGLGVEKLIKLKDLEHAFNVLNTLDKNDGFKNKITGPLIDPRGISIISEHYMERIISLSPIDKIILKHQLIDAQNQQAKLIVDDLKEFMKTCIEWCKKYYKNLILMEFA